MNGSHLSIATASTRLEADTKIVFDRFHIAKQLYPGQYTQVITT